MEDFVLFYDADCGFCRWSVAKILAWDRDRRLQPLALQGPRADDLLGEMSRYQRMASWHLVEPSGRVHSAGAALSPLLRLLPGGRLLAGPAERVAGPIDRIYRFVAEHRGLPGRLVTNGAARRARARIASRSTAAERVHLSSGTATAIGCSTS